MEVVIISLCKNKSINECTNCTGTSFSIGGKAYDRKAIDLMCGCVDKVFNLNDWGEYTGKKMYVQLLWTLKITVKCYGMYQKFIVGGNYWRQWRFSQIAGHVIKHMTKWVCGPWSGRGRTGVYVPMVVWLSEESQKVKIWVCKWSRAFKKVQISLTMM